MLVSGKSGICLGSLAMIKIDVFCDFSLLILII